MPITTSKCVGPALFQDAARINQPTINARWEEPWEHSKVDFAVTMAGTITLGCDCLVGAIDACQGTQSESYRWKCYDIVHCIKYQLKNSTITFLFCHTSGHQDDIKKEYDELDE